MYEDFAPKMAKLVTEYSQPVRPDELVIIRGTSESVPMTVALYEAVLRLGAHPYVWGGLPGLGEMFVELASENQLTYTNPIYKAAMEHVDILYNTFASTNTKSMSRVDPERIKLMQEGGRPLQDIYQERVDNGEIRWCIMPYPTQADAQEAEMSLLGWTKFIYEACKLNLDDPVAHWNKVRDEQTRLTEWLADKSEARVKGPGIDLSFSFKNRTWISAHGERNLPDGEIYTGPIEDSVNGYIEFNLPTLYMGREVNGVRLTYKDGLIVDACADKGQDFLLMQLDLDEGARRMGEFAIGTNWDIQEVTGNTLYDEKIGGTIHMAVGLSLKPTGGLNKSAVHWDMVHDMKDGGEIYIDGELFYRSGEFLV